MLALPPSCAHATILPKLDACFADHNKGITTMSSRKAACIAAGLAALCLANSGHAQENDDAGFYLGVAASRIHHDIGDAYYQRHGRVNTHENSSESGYVLYGGYQANRYLAIEASYADLGESTHFTFCQIGLNCPTIYPYVAQFSTRRADISVLGIVPVGSRFEIYGKLGIARVQDEVSAGFLFHFDQPYTEYDNRIVHGAGMRFRFNADWAVRLHYERIHLPASGTFSRTSEETIGTAWLGLEYRFGAND